MENVGKRGFSLFFFLEKGKNESQIITEEEEEEKGRLVGGITGT